MGLTLRNSGTPLSFKQLDDNFLTIHKNARVWDSGITYEADDITYSSGKFWVAVTPVLATPPATGAWTALTIQAGSLSETISNGNGINTFSYDGSTSQTVSLKVDSDFTFTTGTLNLASSISVNAATASAWATARNVAFATGDVTGNFNISGAADVTNVDLTIGAGVVTNTMLVNSSLTITAGDGLVNGGAVALGGSTTLNVNPGGAISLISDTVSVDITKPTAVTSVGATDLLLINVGGATSGERKITMANFTTSINGSVGANGGLTNNSGNIQLLDYASLTTNYATKWNGTKLVNSVMHDDGTDATLTGGLTVTNNQSIGGDLTITGDLTVNGTTTSINTVDLEVKDKTILIASGVTTTATLDGAGIEFGAVVTGGLVSLTYRNSDNRFVFTRGVEATAFYGNATTASAWATARNVAFATGDVTGNFNISGAADVTNVDLTLENTAVTPAAYGSASSVGTFTVNSQGRLTLAASTPIQIATSQVTGLGSSVMGTIFDAANFVDTSTIDFTVSAGVSVNAVIKPSSVTNAMLVNSTITVDTGGDVIAETTSTSLGGTVTLLQNNKPTLVTTATYAPDLEDTNLQPVFIVDNSALAVVTITLPNTNAYYRDITIHVKDLSNDETNAASYCKIEVTSAGKIYGTNMTAANTSSIYIQEGETIVLGVMNLTGDYFIKSTYLQQFTIEGGGIDVLPESGY